MRSQPIQNRPHEDSKKQQTKCSMKFEHDCLFCRSPNGMAFVRSFWRYESNVRKSASLHKNDDRKLFIFLPTVDTCDTRYRYGHAYMRAEVATTFTPRYKYVCRCHTIALRYEIQFWRAENMAPVAAARHRAYCTEAKSDSVCVRCVLVRAIGTVTCNTGLNCDVRCCVRN